MVPEPHPAGGRETRVGLALIRDLVANGLIVHDETTFQVDNALAVAHVKESADRACAASTVGRRI